MTVTFNDKEIFHLTAALFLSKANISAKIRSEASKRELDTETLKELLDDCEAVEQLINKFNNPLE